MCRRSVPPGRSADAVPGRRDRREPTRPLPISSSRWVACRSLVEDCVPGMRSIMRGGGVTAISRCRSQPARGCNAGDRPVFAQGARRSATTDATSPSSEPGPSRDGARTPRNRALSSAMNRSVQPRNAQRAPTMLALNSAVRCPHSRTRGATTVSSSEHTHPTTLASQDAPTAERRSDQTSRERQRSTLEREATCHGSRLPPRVTRHGRDPLIERETTTDID